MNRCLVFSWLVVSCLMIWSRVAASSFEELAWLIDPSAHPAYVLVDEEFTKSNDPIYLKTWAYEAFLELEQAALASGIDLRITSGWRSFSGQQELFSQYWFERALPPGTSSHHFWQAVDIANSTAWWWAYLRLRDHAHTYWFCQTYDGHSSAQWAESRHYEYHPEEFRSSIVWSRDELYVYLSQQGILSGYNLTKQELFEKYVYPINHACIDDYPSSVQDPLTGIRFDRRLDSKAPDHLVYTLSRYKFPAWSGFLQLLPAEIRFLKSGTYALHFAPISSYPTSVQKLFLNYHQWFREWIERFVLLRVYTKIIAQYQSIRSCEQKK